MTRGFLTRKLRAYIQGQSPVSRSRNLHKIEDHKKRERLFTLRRQYDKRLKECASDIHSYLSLLESDIQLLSRWKSDKNFADSLKEDMNFEKEIRYITKEHKKGTKGSYDRFLGSIPIYFNEQKEAEVQLFKKKDGSFFGVLGYSILSLGEEFAMKIISDVQDEK